MVQLQNPDRLTTSIELGTAEEGYDENDNSTLNFQRILRTACGRWSLGTGQMIQQQGLNLTGSIIVVVHHRNSWPRVTHARFNGQIYEVAQINPDSFMNQTAYDLISLRKVEKNG